MFEFPDTKAMVKDPSMVKKLVKKIEYFLDK